MPFRIENLLKNDATCGSCKKPEKDREDRRVENDQQGSILQQTLLNRLQPPYYRSVSEGSFQPYPCDRLCYPPHFYNPYVVNDSSYAYGRKFYSIYSLPSQTIYPGPYNLYSKRKGGQVRFTPNQTDILEKRFMSNKYLSPEDRKRLADNLKLSDRQVKTWFQNRRAKWRRSTSTSSSETTNDNEKTKEQSEVLCNTVAGQ
ncbi:hematopoietically-expressed homeobox protein HHEX homolog isoform X2 [Anoplophora glabripennis]|uniref:hematopoietically-expressed homeobox protein HHEX homolog isoform X1 n=1 Tax=Anoplophora glabripennis TaxID=217634 RepID=UPI0008740297|nr:hematopoietically-expressed homeobox protein HHEX homolog isoform X1 [Anoplophora glabripennis]XP_018570031.1 hematopoietically-expressed homeobox protein HHEX homolog isoform X2 [Anoplophora glabripennis]